MTKENTILLLKSKLQVYLDGYSRAATKKDSAAAEKWKEGCISIRKRIEELSNS